MEIKNEFKIPVHRETDVFNARIQGKKLAADIGFGEIGVAEIEIVISELGANIVRHAGGRGDMVFRRLRDGNAKGLEIVAQDQGPGIPDSPTDPAARSLRNPPYGLRSLGIGLSGVRRLMDECETNSSPEGTMIQARKWLTCEAADPIRCSVLSRPCFGEEVSGDAYLIKKLPSFVLFGVIDALGHGPKAYEVAQRAVRILEDNFRRNLSELVDRCHQGLKGTRGAAMALARIDRQAKTLDIVSVGNVETRIYGPGRPVTPPGANGTLGMVVEDVRVSRRPYRPGSCIVMFSDGISGRFELNDAILRRTPQEIGAHILSRHGRSHDDATVMVIL